MEQLFEQEVLALIEARIHSCGSAKETAQHFGISQQYLYDIRKGRRGISEKILDKLGLVRRVTYERSKEVTT
jgi:hypothetical protein